MTSTNPWQVDEDHFPSSASSADRLRFLLRYAVLAPSSHNTQPWKFRIIGNQIDVFIDEERWLKVADDDQRELHISVGCAHGKPDHCSKAFWLGLSGRVSAQC